MYGKEIRSREEKFMTYRTDAIQRAYEGTTSSGIRVHDFWMNRLRAAGNHRAKCIIELFARGTLPLFPFLVLQRNFAATDLKVERELSECSGQISKFNFCSSDLHR